MSPPGGEAVEELRIRYRRVRPGRYLVLANGPDSAAAVIDWRPSVDFAHELDELLKEAFSEEPAAEAVDDRLMELGRQLFDALIPVEIQDCVKNSLTVAGGEGSTLRVKFDLPPELQGLPVEILCAPRDEVGLGRFLARNARLSVVRAVKTSQGESPSGGGRLHPRLPQPGDDSAPLSILVVVASPRDRSQLNARGELERLTDELNDLLEGMQWVTIDHLSGLDSGDPVTLSVLSNWVEDRKPLAILLIAHGEIRPDGKQAEVILESDDREAQPVSAESLAAALSSTNSVRLVALNLCVGARIIGREPLSGVAQAIISNGVPAVVGMSTIVSDEAGSRFSAPLFRALVTNQTVDDAVRAARREMANTTEGTRIEWSAPVLCLEDSSMRGRLFRVPAFNGPGNVVDPLLEGQKAVQRLRRNPGLDDIVPAAFYHRITGAWQAMKGVATRGVRESNPDDRQLFERMESEASIELSQGNISELCAALASASTSRRELSMPRLPGVPSSISKCLKHEVARANKLLQRYGQAETAVSERDWKTALAVWEEILRIAPDDQTAIAGREHARLELELEALSADGAAALDAGDWSRAERIFGEILELRPEGYGDAGSAVSYSRGRQAVEPDGEDWAAAVEAFNPFLEQDYRDGRQWLAFAEGRLAETEDRWVDARNAYERVGDGLPDSDAALSCTYAGGRAAELDPAPGAWPAAARAYAALPPDYRDSDSRLRYAQARTIEDDYDWPRAREAYLSLGPIRDAPARAEYMKGRELEDDGRWVKALERYASAAEQCVDARNRADRLTELHEALPWLDDLAAVGLVEDPVASTRPALPYRTLKTVGITPASTMQEVRDASWTLQETDLWSSEVREAWERVRSVAQRLALDARHYQLVDAPGLTREQQDLIPGSAAELLAHLREHLGRDAPLFSLLSGERETALAGWEDRLATDPRDTAAAHALSLAWTWHSIELGDAEEHQQAAEAWEQAIAHWGRVVCAEEYWNAWKAGRDLRYQHHISSADLSRARRVLTEWPLHTLDTQAARCLARDQTDDAERYRRLRLTLEVELAAARALTDADGLGSADESGPQVCGPLLVYRDPGLRTSLGALVARLEAEVERQEDDPIERLRVRGLFSELGEAIVLLDRNQPERVLDALGGLYQVRLSELPGDCECGSDAGAPPSQCPQCAEIVEHNPGYGGLAHRRVRLLQDAVHLATRARLDLARLALGEGRHSLASALTHWREAIDVAANVGMQVRIRRAVVVDVLQRADALLREEEPASLTGERLNEGIELVTAAPELIESADEGQLAAKEAELRIARGIWYTNSSYPYQEPDLERAIADLRRAVKLSPDWPDARDHLCRTLVEWAVSLSWAVGYEFRGDQSSPADRLRLLGEALTTLHEGLSRISGHAQLLAALVAQVHEGGVLEALDEWCHDQAVQDEVLEKLDVPQKSDEPPFGGLLTLIEAVRSAPRDAHAREELIDMVARTIDRT